MGVVVEMDCDNFAGYAIHISDICNTYQLRLEFAVKEKLEIVARVKSFLFFTQLLCKQFQK